MKFRFVFVVYLPEGVAAAADGLGGGVQRGEVRGGGIVGLPHLVNQFVQFPEIGPRRRVGFRGPGLG
nr:hypothetical protein [Salinispora arenicola]